MTSIRRPQDACQHMKLAERGGGGVAARLERRESPHEPTSRGSTAGTTVIGNLNASEGTTALTMKSMNMTQPGRLLDCLPHCCHVADRCGIGIACAGRPETWTLLGPRRPRTCRPFARSSLDFANPSTMKAVELPVWSRCRTLAKVSWAEVKAKAPSLVLKPPVADQRERTAFRERDL